MKCMFITAVCFLFLLKLRWLKNKSIYDLVCKSLIVNNNDLLYFSRYGLKCYECKSEKSWDDCAKSEGDCPAVNDITCESRKAFAKGCFLKSLCNNDFCKNQVPGVTFSKCDINCCDSDLCNGAKVPMMITLLLFACVLVAFRR